ncbi:hypothetical protein [Neisseria dumasiana]|uniref:Uncharacterized protein n=1 Tax=Neisseria dumasiana TaxID=1931275 RepID=A0A1X3DIS7_9NEIS|nr:hypothetical protein [Neisseria dumasiana]OSI21679.1 hypothetical protein BV912_06415 [Neisseria dumasiana]
MIISKTPKSVWKILYRAYRSHKNYHRKYDAIHEQWVDSGYDDEFFNKLDNLYSKLQNAHTLWLDALDVLRQTLNTKHLGLQPDVLCDYAHNKDPYAIGDYTHQEQLKARLLCFREKKAIQAADKARENFDWNNIDTLLCESPNELYGELFSDKRPEYTDREWQCRNRYINMSEDIDAGLSAFQLVDLIARGEFRYGILGHHSRGCEVQPRIP